MHQSPFGGWFCANIQVCGRAEPVLFFHGGWGKIAAAASTQCVVDRWRPDVLINLGTCGGFEGVVERGTVILAERTVVYDIVEMMGDREEAMAHYTTELDLSWLGKEYPQQVKRTTLVSADHDLQPEEIAGLEARFGAVAGDWESGAIAWVAARTGVKCLILRGVTDLVSSRGGEAYGGNTHLFVEGTERVMKALVDSLPMWIEQVLTSKTLGQGA
jgi:adenosylhomocysteine nucleosidase